MRFLFYSFMAAAICFIHLPGTGQCAVISGSSHFPASVGSSWNFNTQTLTPTASGQTLMWGTEIVQVHPDGGFRSVITLPNGNSVTSDNYYTNLGQSIHLNNTRITIKTVDVVPTPPAVFWTETTTVNSYSPTQVVFPASISQGTFETTTSTGTTNLTGITHFTAPVAIDQPMTPTNNVTTQVVSVTVGPTESVTVPAGTFQAIKVTKVFTITEDGTTYAPYNVTEWYAVGIGLVRMDSPNMNRLLTSYNVVQATTQQLTVTYQGDGSGSVNSAPSGINCISSTCPSATFNSGTSVSIVATPDQFSSFGGWSGCDSISLTNTANDTCHVTMNAAHTVSVTYNQLPARIFILGSQNPYQSIQSAYNAAVDSDILQPLATDFAENPLIFGRDVNIILAGGYDAGFLNQTGFTTIQGQVIFQLGSVVLDRLAIR